MNLCRVCASHVTHKEKTPLDSTRENRRMCGAYLTLRFCERRRCWTCVIYLRIFILAPLPVPKVCPCHFFAPCKAVRRMFQGILGAKLCATYPNLFSDRACYYWEKVLEYWSPVYTKNRKIVLFGMTLYWSSVYTHNTVGWCCWICLYIDIQFIHRTQQDGAVWYNFVLISIIFIKQ
jgi:hypothetical protein